MKDIRAGLVTNLEAISGIQWSAYKLSNPTPPCGFVWVGPADYDFAMSKRPTTSSDDLTLMLTVYAAMASDKGAAKRLEGLLDPDGSTSVKQALEADRTLGGIVDTVHVLSHAGEQVYAPDGKGQVLGTDFTIRVIT